MPIFDLCPKCGAVSKNGLCSSCGYQVPGVYPESEETDKDYAVQPEQQADTDGIPKPQKVEMPQYNSTNGYNSSKSNAGLYAVLGIIGAIVVVMVIFVVCGTYYFAKKTIGGLGSYVQSQSDSNESFDIYDWLDDYDYPSFSGGETDDDYIYRYGYFDGHLSEVIQETENGFATNEWVKMEQDPYLGMDPTAYEFDNYIDTDVSYYVEKSNWVYSNENGFYDSDSRILPHYLYMTGSYVRLRNTGLKNEEQINEKIYDKAVEAADIGELAVYYLSSDSDDSIYVQNDVYVTYMDEKVISIMFYGTGYIIYNSGTEDEKTESVMSRIYSINIDLTNGEEILASETFAFDGNFYQTFKNRCLEQNGAPIDFYDDNTLISILSDDDQVVWAYTPLGLEVGVNRESFSGWATCTFVDYSQFYKIY